MVDLLFGRWVEAVDFVNDGSGVLLDLSGCKFRMVYMTEIVPEFGCEIGIGEEFFVDVIKHFPFSAFGRVETVVDIVMDRVVRFAAEREKIVLPPFLYPKVGIGRVYTEINVVSATI